MVNYFIFFVILVIFFFLLRQLLPIILIIWLGFIIVRAVRSLLVKAPTKTSSTDYESTYNQSRTQSTQQPRKDVIDVEYTERELKGDEHDN